MITTTYSTTEETMKRTTTTFQTVLIHNVRDCVGNVADRSKVIIRLPTSHLIELIG